MLCISRDRLSRARASLPPFLSVLISVRRDRHICARASQHSIPKVGRDYEAAKRGGLSRARGSHTFLFRLILGHKTGTVRIHRRVFVHLSRGEDHLSCSSRRFHASSFSSRVLVIIPILGDGPPWRAGHRPGALPPAKLLDDDGSEIRDVPFVDSKRGGRTDQKEIGRR